MRDSMPPKVSKWPFFLGDALLLALAWFVCTQTSLPLGGWPIAACVVCVATGAWLGVAPFVMDHRAAVRLAESNGLASTVAQIQNLETLAAQISYATNQWQVVREAADKTTNAARDIANGMVAEVKSFNEFVQRANDGEKATLRLEVDKLRRAERDWLQVLIHILDHVHALHQAGTRSRQPGVSEQLGRFQAACHDAARRIGLTPFIAMPAEAFDEKRHQLADADAKPDAGAKIGATLATGYTFQGRMIRPALVQLHNGAEPEPALAEDPPPGPARDQGDLPLQQSC